MADSDQSEKTEEATPFKIEEARKKGMVMKSQEINHVMVIATGLLLMIAIGEDIVQASLMLCKTIFLRINQIDFSVQHLLSEAAVLFEQGFALMSPIVIAIMLVSILTTLVQTKPNISFYPLKPDWNKLSPIKGFKKIFGIKMLFELAKSIIKLIVLGAILYFMFVQTQPFLMSLIQRSPASATAVFISQAAVLVFHLLLALILVAILDLIFSQKQYQKNLRMSKHEVKQEYKRREGDPQIKSKRQQLQQELRKRTKTLGRVPEADVIVTNPTHFAILLKYDQSTMMAPKVIGKGTDLMAQKIKALARTHRIPIFEQRQLARALYQENPIDTLINESHYEIVAKILKQAYRQSGRALSSNSAKTG